jgi:hypothetical protein
MRGDVMGVVSHRDSGDLNASITSPHPINLQKRGHSPLKKGQTRGIPPLTRPTTLPPDEGGRGEWKPLAEARGRYENKNVLAFLNFQQPPASTASTLPTSFTGGSTEQPWGTHKSTNLLGA